MLFLLYANSLPGTVKSSHVAAFADDTKKSPTDATRLQDDLSNLATWSSSAGLMFNKSQVQGTTNYLEAQLCVQHVPHKWGSTFPNNVKQLHTRGLFSPAQWNALADDIGLSETISLSSFKADLLSYYK